MASPLFDVDRINIFSHFVMNEKKKQTTRISSIGVTSLISLLEGGEREAKQLTSLHILFIPCRRHFECAMLLFPPIESKKKS